VAGLLRKLRGTIEGRASPFFLIDGFLRPFDHHEPFRRGGLFDVVHNGGRFNY